MRHVFPNGAVLDDSASSSSLAVASTGGFGGALVQTASTGFLGSTGGGDSVIVADAAGILQLEVAYGGEAATTRASRSCPISTATPVPGSEVSPDGSLWSPGPDR